MAMRKKWAEVEDGVGVVCAGVSAAICLFMGGELDYLVATPLYCYTRVNIS